MIQRSEILLKSMGLILILSILSCSKDDSLNPPINNAEQLKIMSFNMRYDNENDGENKWTNRKEACISMFKETQPDVFGIQEGLSHQVEFLDDQLNDYNYYGVGRDDGINSGEYAAIYYNRKKYNLVDSGTFWLSETPEIPSIGWDADLERISSWVKLEQKSSGNIFYVFNTHFDHKGNLARIESAKLIVENIYDIINIGDPVFILGDFNGLIGNKMFDPILSRFKNAKKEAKETDEKKSFNNFGKYGGLLNINIDFIFFKNVEVLKYQTITKNYGVDYISDHYPILGYFKFNPTLNQ